MNLNHFDFFTFYDEVLVIACDDDDNVIGYFVLKDKNALCQLFIHPKYRGKGIVHVLIWKAYEMVKDAGCDYIWGVMYPGMKALYEQYCDKWGATMVVIETPEEREDGQWNLRFYFDKVTEDKKPQFRRTSDPDVFRGGDSA